MNGLSAGLSPQVAPSFLPEPQPALAPMEPPARTPDPSFFSMLLRFLQELAKGRPGFTPARPGFADQKPADR